MPGIVFVQADGVPFPVLEWGVRAGHAADARRGGSATGSHRMAEWRPKLPATTPASQMGILHGTIEGIPAFRWVDRAEGRVYVANKPADAAAIEAMHSDGRGLLVDDGVSVSNLFTGDAPDGVRHHERGPPHAGDPAGPADAVAVPDQPGGLGPQHVADLQRDRPRAVPGVPVPSAATSGPACTAAGTSPASGPR